MRTKEELQLGYTVKVGQLVLPLQRIFLDASLESGKPLQIAWLPNEMGIVIELESDPPKGATPENWMAKIFHSGGVGWCFQDEFAIVPMG